jgi:hypothetical protein
MIRRLWLLLSHRDHRCPGGPVLSACSIQPSRRTRSLVLVQFVSTTRDSEMHRLVAKQYITTESSPPGTTLLPRCQFYRGSL